MDLLETQNTEESAQEPSQETEGESAQEPSQETEGASAQDPNQETEGASAQETDECRENEGESAQETEGVSNPTSNHSRRQIRRNQRYFNNDFINIVISKTIEA